MASLSQPRGSPWWWWCWSPSPALSPLRATGTSLLLGGTTLSASGEEGGGRYREPAWPCRESLALELETNLREVPSP